MLTIWLASIALVLGYIEYGPTPVRSSISIARIRPSFAIAIFASTRWSRAWMSDRKDSSRSATNFTGRLSAIDSPTVAISSA